MRTEFNHETRKLALRRSGGECEASGARYGLAEGKRCCMPLGYGVVFDHDTPDAIGGSATLENCRAICTKCNRHKTDKTDARQIAKARRQESKNNGTWPKPKGNARIPSRPFASTRDQFWGGTYREDQE